MSTAAPLQNLAAKLQAPSSSTHAGLLLQRKCACGSPTASLTGECAECKSKKFLQAKLTIGASNDPLEQEADRVADQVMAASAHPTVSGAPPRIQRFSGHANGEMDAAPASVDRVIAGSGRPLEPALRQDMEQRFGHNFSRVRVHSGVAAGQSARDVSANAYAVGQNIVFGAGRFAPGTHEGRRLIAHELTHVLQQSDTQDGSASEKSEQSTRFPIHSRPAPNAPSSSRRRLEFESSAHLHVARQQKPGSDSAAEPTPDESVEDKWKGTPVSEIMISLARHRVGFRIPQGILLGTVKTDLAVGKYEVTPDLAKQQWNIQGPGVKTGLRFDVDLTESSAQPWTLLYPAKLTLNVTSGVVDPKTAADLLKDPLFPYEDGGEAKPSGPVVGIDDYETIELVKATVAPTGSKVKDTPPYYKVKYRDKSERLLVYAELSPKMRAQLRPLFEKADEEFLLFAEQTFPMWWSIVGTVPLVQMPASGARPYIPKRVPLAPREPSTPVPAGELPAVPGAPGSKSGELKVPAGTVMSDAQAFTQARNARNTMVEAYNQMSKAKRSEIAAVTGGVNIETGQVAGGYNTGGRCAEDMVVERLGGDASKIRFSEAIRPRYGQQQQKVCLGCQGKYPKEQFPEGAIFEGSDPPMPKAGQ